MVTDWEPDPDDPKDINVSQEDEDVSKSKVNTIFETLGLTPIKLCEINRSKNCLYTKLKELQDAVLLCLGISCIFQTGVTFFWLMPDVILVCHFEALTIV